MQTTICASNKADPGKSQSILLMLVVKFERQWDGIIVGILMCLFPATILVHNPTIAGQFHVHDCMMKLS
jgi:hypothetical protein